jgi:hypothetical protein
MNRFMLSITVATAALLGAHQALAQTILYTPPGVSVEAVQPLPLGQFIAGRIEDKDATEFKNWLANSDIQGNFDVKKGYTAFAVVDSAFDPSKPDHPIEHYIVNQRVGLSVMQGNSDNLKALNGDTLVISRTGNSYYVDGQRVNGVIKNPEGSIYLIGGPISAQNI